MLPGFRVFDPLLNTGVAIAAIFIVSPPSIPSTTIRSQTRQGKRRHKRLVRSAGVSAARPAKDSFARRIYGELAVRHGERSFQRTKASVVQAVDLSVWQTLQALGTFRLSVRTG
jgi:hypothetical protein